MPNTIAATTGPIVLVYGTYSHEGRRPTQEDRHEVCEFQTAGGMNAMLALVADGIGGRNTGERASHLAKEVICDYVKEKAPAASEIPLVLNAAFQEANRRIYDEAVADPNRAGMGTTCTVVVIVGNRLYLAHVGDSRVYLVRANRIQQLSIDHTWAEEALQAGRPLKEIRQHPNRGVIKRYLGINPEVNVDSQYRLRDASGVSMQGDTSVRPLSLEAGDSLMLCTDGLSDILDDHQILGVVRRTPAPQAARALVERALKADAADNVTAVVIDLPGAKKGGGIPAWVRWSLPAVLILGMGLVAAAYALGWFAKAPAESTPTPTLAVIVAPTAIPPTEEVFVATPTSTAAPEPSATPTAVSPTPTSTPVAQLSQPTATLVPTYTPTPVPTDTPTPTPSPTWTPTSTPEPPTPTPSPKPEQPTPRPTESPPPS